MQTHIVEALLRPVVEPDRAALSSAAKQPMLNPLVDISIDLIELRIGISASKVIAPTAQHGI